MSLNLIGRKLDSLSRRERELNKYYNDPNSFSKKNHLVFEEMRKDYLEDLDTYGRREK
jgi:hypothetical protein